MRPKKVSVLESLRLLGYIHSLFNHHFPTPNRGLHKLRTFRRFFVASLALGCAAKGQTYGSGSHTVTVQVSQVTVVQVSSGTVNLTISGASAVAGQNSMTVTDLSTSFLWGTNVSQRKVTVQTNLASPIFTLKLLAVSPTQGTAGPEVTLSTIAQDFLTNIAKSSGSTQLRYTGVALASQGTGSDAHTITYTVTVQ